MSKPVTHTGADAHDRNMADDQLQAVLAAAALRALFRWKADKEGLVFGFVWHRAEYMRQARFQQIAAQAAEETGLPYILGRVA